MPNPYSKLAQEAIAYYLQEGKLLSPPANLPPAFFQKQGGVFVTLKNASKLRGCIGTFLPVQENLAQEIIHNAVSAAREDYRFAPVRLEELPKLDIEVSLLAAPQSLLDPQKHDSKKHGVIVQTSDGRSGLLLPDIEGVKSLEQQLDIACQKGSINPQTDDPQIYYFTVEKHSS